MRVDLGVSGLHIYMLGWMSFSVLIINIHYRTYICCIYALLSVSSTHTITPVALTKNNKKPWNTIMEQKKQKTCMLC